MMMLKFAGTSLVLATLLMACSPAAEEGAPAETATAETPAPFVPADFEVPTLVEADGFKLVPLGPDLVEVDYAAYMSSIEHLQQTFTRSTGWPREGITDEEAMLDMETEQGRFERRESFAYGVLTPDGSRELGSLYVRPSPVADYDAMVMLWVTKADYDAGFDEELYAWAQDWVASAWPFAKVAWPGRANDWDSWDALVTATESEARATEG